MESIVFGVIALLVLTLIFKSIYIVPQGQHYVLERLGQFQMVLRPGLHLLMPVIQTVRYKVNMMEKVIEIPPLNAISKDNISVIIDAIAYIQIFDAEKSSYEIQDSDDALSQLINTTLRSELGEMELDGIFSSRAQINSNLMKIMDEATRPWGIKVTRIEVRDVQPPRELLDAMSMQVRAEREKRAKILVAEGERQADITKAEGAKQSWILQAEGTKEAQILKAQGEQEAAILQAKAREALANAEAEATKTVSEAIKAGDSKALDYFLGQKYVEAFKALAESDNKTFVMMPTELTSLAGLAGGLKNFIGK
jgi:regulator of protease activity HflC (stomatin/prohibitin superfamily)